MLSLRLFTLAGLLATSLGALAQSVPTRPLRTALPEHRPLAARGKATTIVVPGRAVAWRWDQTQNQWTESKIQTYTFDSKARLAHYVEADSATAVPQQRMTYTYNGADEIVGRLQEVWQNGAWSNSERYQEFYDQHNQLLEERTDECRAGAWQQSRGSRWTNTYNTAGVLVERLGEYWDPQTSSYTRSGREIYTLNAQNQWATIQEQRWDNGAYVNDYLITSLAWHNWDARQRSQEQYQRWNTTTAAWDAPYYRATTTYGLNNSFVQLSEDFGQGSWQPSFRTTVNFNSAGRMTDYRDESWTNNAWVLQYADRITTTYTAAGAPVREFIEAYSSGQFQNRQLFNYSNFQNITLAARPALVQAAASVYPNPAAQTVTIDVAELSGTAPVQAELVNMLGQTLRTYTLPVQQGRIRQELIVSQLPTGVYNLRLHTTQGIVSKRIVKK